MKRRKLSSRRRRQLYRIQSRIYDLFNKERWKIRYARINQEYDVCVKHEIKSVTSGFVDNHERIIWIDYREDVVPAIVHECLHIIYPDLPEYKIRRLESFMMRNMSRIQIVRLMRHTGNFLI